VRSSGFTDSRELEREMRANSSSAGSSPSVSPTSAGGSFSSCPRLAKGKQDLGQRIDVGALFAASSASSSAAPSCPRCTLAMPAAAPGASRWRCSLCDAALETHAEWTERTAAEGLPPEEDKAKLKAARRKKNRKRPGKLVVRAKQSAEVSPLLRPLPTLTAPLKPSLRAGLVATAAATARPVRGVRWSQEIATVLELREEGAPARKYVAPLHGKNRSPSSKKKKKKKKKQKKKQKHNKPRSPPPRKLSKSSASTAAAALSMLPSDEAALPPAAAPSAGSSRRLSAVRRQTRSYFGNAVLRHCPSTATVMVVVAAVFVLRLVLAWRAAHQ